MNTLKKILLVNVGVLALSSVAMAQNGGAAYTAGDPPITVGGGWNIFDFGVAGPGGDSATYTYTSATPTDLLVTDSFLYGDQFAVYDNGVLLGDTSVPGTGPIESDPDASWAEPYSKGTFLIGPGSQSIVIEPIVSPYTEGGAYLEVNSAPDAGQTSLLLGGALTLVGAFSRKFRK